MFDPVRSYDKPAVILTQLANGIATTDSVRRVLFDPAALSPRERESFVEELKGKLGGNAVSDTAVDVLSNPLVWLGVLASAAGGAPGVRNVAAGRRFFAASGAGSYAAKNWPILRFFRLTSGTLESQGTRINGVMQGAINDMSNARTRLGAMMEDEAGRLLTYLSQKHGVKVTRLEPENAPNDAVARDLRDIRAVNAIRRLGWDRDRTEKVVTGIEAKEKFVRVWYTNEKGEKKIRTLPVDDAVFDPLGKRYLKNKNFLVLGKHDVVLDQMPGVKRGETMKQSMQRLGMGRLRYQPGLPKDQESLVGKPDAALNLADIEQGGARVRFENVQRNRLFDDDAAMQAVEREFDLGRFQDAERKFYELGRVFLAGDEGAYEAGRGFVMDRAKVLNLVRGKIQGLHKARYMTESGQIVSGGEDAVRMLLSDEVSARLIKSAEQRKGTRIKQGATAAEIEQVLVDAYEEGFKDPHYMPRNTVEAYDKMGRRMAYNPYTGEAGYDATQGAEQGTLPSGRGMLRSRTTQIGWDPGDLEYMSSRFGGNVHAQALINMSKMRVQGQVDRGNMYRVMRIAPDVAASKYVASVSRDYAIFTKDVTNDPETQAIVRDFSAGGRNQARLPGPLGKSAAGAPVGVRDLAAVPADMRPVGRYNRFDLIESELQAMTTANPEDKYLVEQWRRNIIPAALGIKPADDAAHQAAAGYAREGAKRLANSRFMRAVEGQNKYAAQFVQQLRAWGNDSAADEFMPWQAATRLLYGSHMGLNMGTVLINLLQPLQSVHQLGFRNTVKAYAQSFEQIGEYLKVRRKLGPAASPADIKAAMSASFRRRFGGTDIDISALADIGSTWGTIEQAGYGATPLVGKPQFSLLETMMKPFQLSETLNRTVTANAMLNAYERVGRVGADDAVRAGQDAALAVQLFQFGSSPLNRPAAFYLPGLRNPAFRQFAQYGIRSFANVFAIPKMVDPTRKAPVMQDLARLMAVSAVAYEVGKNVLGADLSRGLAFGMTDLVGGQQALQGDQPPLYIPPVVDVGWNAVKFLGTGDSEILQDILPRVIPGGVAVSRLIGAAPPSETLQAVGLQRTYADWRQSESGNVPVYNTDGRFMGQYSTSDVVLRAFGADLGRFNNPQELSQFLLKNRDAIRDGRRQYIAAVLGNNMGAAKRVKVDFEKRFGMPLTVTQDQMKQAIKLREESVVGRTLETMDVTARDMYRRAVEETLPGQLMAGGVPGQPTEQGDVYRWGSR